MASGLRTSGIPGGYWAASDHPATDRPLVEEVFGQVHMLSHMVGSSNRVDITRLRTLERELGERDDKIARQEARLAAGARDRAELLRKVESLEAELRRHEIAALTTAEPTTRTPTQAALLERQDFGEGACSQSGVSRRGTGRSGRQSAEIRRDPAKQKDQLHRESTALEAELKIDDARAARRSYRARSRWPDPAVCRRPPWTDRSVEGGAARRGGTLFSHDGGIEENLAAMPGRRAGPTLSFSRSIASAMPPRVRSRNFAATTEAVRSAADRECCELYCLYQPSGYSGK